MNIYFLVEGKRTEMKVYPKWLSYLIPELQRSTTFDSVTKNNYFIFSGNGFPSLLDNHLRNCVIDVNNAGNYDCFVICLDADEQSIEACKQEILDFMEKENIRLNAKTEFKIIDKDGTISKLNTFEGIPSDKNYLNDALADGNELFDSLLEIEQSL